MLFLLLIVPLGLLSTDFYLGAFLPNDNYTQWLNHSFIQAAIEIGVESANEYIMKDENEIKVIFEIIGRGNEVETPDLAIEILEQFQDEDNVVAVIGNSMSYCAIETVPHLEVPMLSFASATELIENNFFFRMVSSSSIFCSAMVDVIFSMGFNSLNIILDDDEYSLFQLIDCINATDLNDMDLELDPIILYEDNIEDILQDMEDTLEKDIPIILLLGARRTAQTIDDLLVDLKNHNLLDEGFIWIVNVILGNRIDNQKGQSEVVFSELTQGLIFVTEGDMMFQREYNFQLQMMNITGMTDPSHVYPYRLYHDSVLVFAEGIQSLIDEGEDPAGNPNLLIDSIFDNVDFIGASGRITFLRLNNGERSFYDIDVQNSEGYLKYDQVAKWSASTLFQWDIGCDNLTLPGPTTADQLGIVLKDDVPDQYRKFVNVPFVGLSPETSVGYCSGLYTNSEGTDYFVVFGGEAYDLQFDNIFLFDIKTARWTEVQPKATSSSSHPPVAFHACTIRGDYLYVFGGIQSGALIDSLWYFDLVSMEWFEVVPLHSDKPMPRFGSKMEYIEGLDGKDYLLVFGGRGETTLFNDVWLFDLDGDNWVIKFSEDELPMGRYSFSMGVVEESGVLVVWGGRTSMISIRLNNVTSLDTNDMWRLDIRGINSDYSCVNWTKIKTQENVPTARFGQGTVSIGNMMYVLFGYSLIDKEVFGDYYRVDISHLSDPDVDSVVWEELSEVQDMGGLEGRIGLDLTAWDGQILIFGGMAYYYTNNEQNYLTDFWLVNTLEDTFLKIHSHFLSPTPMYYFESFVFGQWLFTFGGLDDSMTPTSRMYKLDMINFEWYRVNPVGVVPERRYASCSVTFNGQFWIFGGLDSNDDPLSDFWVFNPFSAEFRELETMEGMSGYSHHSCISIEEKMYVIGGMTGNEKTKVSVDVEEFYVFNLVDESWTVEKIKESEEENRPQGLLNCQTFLNTEKTIVYFEGCSAFTNALPYIYRLHLTDNSWIPPIPVPVEYRSTQHSLVELDDHLFMFIGGRSYSALAVSNMVVELYMSSDDSVEFRFVDTETVTKPPPSLGSRCHYYKSMVYCFGGMTGVEFEEKYDHYDLGTLTANGVVNTLWLFVNDYVCRPGQHSTSLSTCLPCSPGTYFENGVCLPCEQGKYSSDFEYECLDCPKGYFGNETSANSRFFCLPCPHGQYNDKSGSSSCTPCPENKYCPVGSTNPYDEVFGDSDQVVTQPVHFLRNMYGSVIIYSVTFVVGILLHMVLCCCWYTCWGCRCCNIKCLLFWDIFFENKHGSNQNPKGRWYPGMKVVKKTLVGSYFSTFGFMLLFSYTISSVIIWQRGLDDDETRSLVPRIFSTETASKYASSIYANVVFYDYQSECGHEGKCENGIDVKIFGLVEGESNVNCVRGGSSSNGICEVLWVCEGCYVGDIEESEISMVTTVSTADSFTTKYHYHVQFTTGYQNNKDKVSAVEGELVGDKENVFRGLSTPSSVNLLLIESRYRKELNYRTERGYGYHLDFLNLEEGQQAEIENFHEDNGFQFEINFEMAPYTLEIVRTSPSNIFTFIVGLLSSYVGILSVLAIFMRAFELCIEKCCCCAVVNDYKDWMNVVDDRKKRQVLRKRRKEMKKLGMEEDGEGAEQFVNTTNKDLMEPFLTPTPGAHNKGKEISPAIFDDSGEDNDQEEEENQELEEATEGVKKEEEDGKIVFSDVDVPGSRSSINFSATGMNVVVNKEDEDEEKDDEDEDGDDGEMEEESDGFEQLFDDGSSGGDDDET